jgi:hypothetical protein
MYQFDIYRLDERTPSIDLDLFTSLTTTPEFVAAPNYSAVSIGSTPFA